MAGGGIGKIAGTKTIAGMTVAMSAKEHASYAHNEGCLSRWTTRESFQYMYARPWHKISDFYLKLVRGGGCSSLYNFFSYEKNNPKIALYNYLGVDEEQTLVNLPSKNRQGRWERNNFKIVLSYHGGSFDGWQKQPSLNTVQGLVEKSLGIFVDEMKAQQLKKKSLPLEGCVSVAGRTDKGVSALQQVCSFYTWRKNISCSDLKEAVNAVAPGKIRALLVSEVSRTFHPNFSAKWRRYCYIFPMEGSLPRMGDDAPLQQQAKHMKNTECSTFDTRDEFDDVGIWTKPSHFSVNKVNQLLCQLEGRSLSYSMFARDTKASKSCGPPTECFIFHARAIETKLPCASEVTCTEFTEELKVMCVELVANRFLRKMVRVLVATAIREAAADADADALLKLMAASCRRATAPPAPPEGLCLVDVGYEEFNRENSLIL